MPANDQHFDPRFDPAFQRGFGGEPKQPQQLEEPQRRTAAPVVQQVPPPAPVREPPPTPPTAARAAAAGAPASPPQTGRDDRLFITDGGANGAAVDRSSESANDTADDAAAAPRPWTNPFFIALAVVAVALVTAGIWMFQTARESFLGSATNSQADYATLTVLLELAPLLLVLGTGTAIGIVFFLAADWQKRRR